MTIINEDGSIEEVKEMEDKKMKLVDVLNWVDEHQTVFTIGLPAAAVVLGGASKIVKSVNNRRVVKEQKCRIYDRSLGKYIYLKRELKPSELRKISERKIKGEKLIEILLDMNLVKG